MRERVNGDWILILGVNYHFKFHNECIQLTELMIYWLEIIYWVSSDIPQSPMLGFIHTVYVIYTQTNSLVHVFTLKKTPTQIYIWQIGTLPGGLEKNWFYICCQWMYGSYHLRITWISGLILQIRTGIANTTLQQWHTYPHLSKQCIKTFGLHACRAICTCLWKCSKS